MPRTLRFLFGVLMAVVSACSSPQPTPPTPPTPTIGAPVTSVPARPAASAQPSASAAASPSPLASPSAAPRGNATMLTTDPAIHIFLWGNAATTDRDLKLAREGGFHWVKQRFEWRNIEGKAKGSFEWNEPDRIVDAIAQQGLKIVARIDNQPQWASSAVTWPGTAPAANAKDWSDYVTALATRYKGRIQAYEIWNEPNLDREWGNKTPDPQAYTAMLKDSYKAIKAADPQALVISAGMSPTTTNNAQALPDMEFLRQMYAAGAKDSFDVLGVHAAGFKAEPCADPATVAQDAALTNNDPNPPEARRVYAFRHVEDVRNLMVQQGDSDKQMAVLEMGWTTDARPGSAYAWFAVDRDQQAKNLVGAFQCARQNWQPWMGLMSVIYIPDAGWTQQQEQYWWSITNPDGSARPAYTALKGFFAANP